MTDLLPCPLCGANDVYALHAGSTYRYYYVHCTGCGEIICETRAGEHRFDKEPPKERTAEADASWNLAAEHCHRMKSRGDLAVEALREMVEAFGKPMPPIDSARYEALRSAQFVLELEE